jgi:NAD(P)-dependent dehydrogenase (short-subunit alcohol dehydrogenase family)
MTSVLITGAGRGLGLATALLFARRGWSVHAGVPFVDPGDELHAALAAEDLPVRVVPMDVTDPASVDAAVAGVLAADGAVDVLVNNAGIGTLGTVEGSGDDALRPVLEVNLLGALRVVRAVLPSMRARRSGTVVTMSSVNGRIALPVGGPYFISKHALEAASEMLAVEVNGFGIRVAIVEPGAFATRILRDGVESATPADGSPYATVERRSAAMVAQGIARAGDPAEVAAAVLHAVTTDAPRLRYLVGGDAVGLLAARARVTDEQWVAFGGLGTDEEYYAAMAALFAPPTADAA